jgi:hypothetical protein
LKRVGVVAVAIAFMLGYQNCSPGFVSLGSRNGHLSSFESAEKIGALNRGLPSQFTLAANSTFKKLNDNFHPDVVFYVDGERGDDRGVGTSSAPLLTLSMARTRVRQARAEGAKDVAVILRGMFRIEATEEFTAADSAPGGAFTVYVGDPEKPATLSGAKVLAGKWIRDSAGRMTFPAGGLSPRSLSINDRAVMRARTAQPLLGSIINADDTVDCRNCDLPPRQSTSAVEVVFAAGWQSARCKGALDPAGKITLVKPCAQLALHNVVPVTKVLRMELAPAFISGEGQWAFDTPSQTIHYSPRAGENLEQARVAVPLLERLIVAKNLANVAFVGLKFQDVAWRQPQTDVGFATHQADVFRNGQEFSWTTFAGTELMPASFECIDCRGIVVMQSEFTNLEGSGIRIGDGSNTNLVFANSFHDIGGSAIQIGTTDPSTPSAAVARTYIEDNLIDFVARDFASSPGIFQYYATDSFISQNTIQNLPYSGVSVGWGWTLSTIPNSARNHITKNHVKNVMGLLQDGGGIYLNAAQAGGEVSHNFVQNVLSGLSGINPYPSAMGVYLDNGVRGVTVNNNVAMNIASQALFIQNIVEPFALDNPVAADGVAENDVRRESGRRALPLRTFQAGEQLAFGGMYGYGAEGSSKKIYPNPFTGRDSCPSGYTAQPFLGTSSLDWPAFFCYRVIGASETADYDFGGLYGFSFQKSYPNPQTGTTSCPAGYESAQVLGATDQDWPLYACGRRHVSGAKAFQGLFGFGSVEQKEIGYIHPLTGQTSCPAGTSSTIVYGTDSLDWAVYQCD